VTLSTGYINRDNIISIAKESCLRLSLLFSLPPRYIFRRRSRSITTLSQTFLMWEGVNVRDKKLQEILWEKNT